LINYHYVLSDNSFWDRFLFSAINFNSECDYVDAGYPMGLSYWESSLYYRILNKKEFEEES
ncbi:hypothetical protein ACRU1U_19400, partial [Providencia stuartii]